MSLIYVHVTIYFQELNEGKFRLESSCADLKNKLTFVEEVSF